MHILASGKRHRSGPSCTWWAVRALGCAALTAVVVALYRTSQLDPFHHAHGESVKLGGVSRFNVVAANFRCPLPQGGRWCTAVSGDKQWEMAVHYNDYVSNAICTNHFWEFPTPAAMGVAPGASTLLDIGANLGWFSFMFAQHGFKVLAVEPMTANRELLNATLCRNPELVDRVEIKAVALTDAEVPGRTCPIYSDRENLGDGILACSPEEDLKAAHMYNKNTIFRERVPLTTLNSVLASASLQRFDMVKMDVERQECHVLAGGQKLFTDYHPKLVAVEVFESTIQCIVPFVKQFGKYKVHSGSFAGPVIEDERFDHDHGKQVATEVLDLYLTME